MALLLIERKLRQGHSGVVGNRWFGYPTCVITRLRRGMALVTDITQKELQEWLDERRPVMIVDVREPAEFSNGHVPGAQLAPLKELADKAQTWDQDTQVVVVCHSGNRSQRAAAWLEQMGFRHVSNLSGGMQAWRGPVE